MNPSILFIVFLSVYFIPCNLYSQRSNKPVDDKPKIVRPSPKPIKTLPAKSKTLVKTRIPSPDQKIKVDRGNSFTERNDKIKDNRPPRRNPSKRKKPILKNEPIVIVNPVQTIIIGEIPDLGYCIVENGEFYSGIEISEYSYPDFPLRFLDANIVYECSYEGEDYYKIILEVKAVYNNYFDKFGILIRSSSGAEQVIILNENEEILRLGDNYNFQKQIIIKETGYMNLRLGYYDDELKIFYPELLHPNKTDKLIFLGIPDRVYVYSYN